MKRLIQTCSALALFGAMAQFASANSITLTGTVRDFTPAHPDFESSVAFDPGIVANTLGLDGKPVYAGGTQGTTHGATYFNQWFNDVSGVNLSTSYSITLNETTPGTYQYSNGAFFPIDGQLFGNYAYGHNYHFTYELHTQFTYNSGSNQTFYFSGDDDVWVFINKQLVIDLGGVHGTMSDSVSLNSLGLTSGNNYSLDFFFAERHTTGSNFTMTTGNLQLSTANVPDAGASLGLLGLAAVVLAFVRRYLR